eukprot:5542224-Pleurochrysis_carterae.AAC.1
MDVSFDTFWERGVEFAPPQSSSCAPFLTGLAKDARTKHALTSHTGLHAVYALVLTSGMEGARCLWIREVASVCLRPFAFLSICEDMMRSCHV